MHTYDFSPMLRYSVGFDRMQKILESATLRAETSYPPYNIETDNGDIYRITVAVAGFQKDELEIVAENETLTINGVKKKQAGEANFMHRGIASRNFRLQFSLADHIHIKEANLESGLLVIDLERELPEELKPRTVEIKSKKISALVDKAKNLISPDPKVA